MKSLFYVLYACSFLNFLFRSMNYFLRDHAGVSHVPSYLIFNLLHDFTSSVGKMLWLKIFHAFKNLRKKLCFDTTLPHIWLWWWWKPPWKKKKILECDQRREKISMSDWRSMESPEKLNSEKIKLKNQGVNDSYNFPAIFFIKFSFLYFSFHHFYRVTNEEKKIGPL